MVQRKPFPLELSKGCEFLIGRQVYNTTFVRWTTHNPKGLSEKDISMAALCDELAQAFGEQPVESQGSSEGKDLVGCAVDAAGDCCGPKK